MLARLLTAITAAGLLVAPAFAEIGRIKRVYGQASILRGTATLPATSGFALLEKDVLATGPDGRISIAFVDNTRFSVGPKSKIALSQFKFDETTHQGSRFDTTVERGSLAVVSGQIAHESKDAMRVRTPTSLLGVRGTRFVVVVK
jgi:hypothetical protein